MSEGFTEHFTFKHRLDWKLISASVFADRFNEALVEVHTSPFAADDNQSLGGMFFDIHEASSLVYSRGFLVAGLWDSRLQKEKI